MSDRLRVAIIGGSGRMGRWFADLLLKEGKEVIITGRNERKLREAQQELAGVEIAINVEAVKDADVIVVSVPIASFEEVVKEIAPYTHSEQIIMDVTSIKTSPVDIMHKYIKKGTILGTHPVFGPGARSLVNQNFVLTPTNDSEDALADKVKEYLEARGASVTLMTPQEHDQMMAFVLGLSHFIAIVSADTLLSCDRLEQLEAIGGTTYKVLLTLVDGVISADPELYASIQMSLPNVTLIERLFQTNAKKWADFVENRNSREFAEQMNALRLAFEQRSPSFGKAFENVYKLAENSER